MFCSSKNNFKTLCCCLYFVTFAHQKQNSHIIMNSFIFSRITKILNSSDIINSNYRSSVLADDLGLNMIDFSKSRGAVRLINQNVLTPADENRMLNEILAYDFEK